MGSRPNGMSFYVICSICFIWAVAFIMWNRLEAPVPQLEAKYDAKAQVVSACKAYLERVDLEESQKTEKE